MKLNCDLGESFGSWKMGLDEAVMPNIDMANIACGFHAGDENVMFKTLSLAKMHNVEVGAHPGYKDIQGFGRRSIPHTDQEIINLVSYQVAAIVGVATCLDMNVTYVKPHGALYNDMMKDADVRFAIYRALQSLNKNRKEKLKLMMLATNEADIFKQEASTFGVELLMEAFADRRYTPDGRLQNRSVNGAVLNKQEMLEQVNSLVNHGQVTTSEGTALAIQADTICVHGDNDAGVQLIREVRELCIND
jgi:UPF0271 protein